MPRQPTDKDYQVFELQYARFVDRRTARFLAHLETARREIYTLLIEQNTANMNTSRSLSLISQLEVIERNTIDSINREASSVTAFRPFALGHLQEQLTLIGYESIATSTALTSSFNRLNLDVLQSFSDLQFKQVKTLVASQLQALRVELFNQVAVQGNNSVTVARNLVAKDAPRFAGLGSTLENIIRTESSTVYNEIHLNGIKQVNKDFNLALKKRISEVNQPSRNHPISRVLNKLIAEVDQPFKVKVVDIRASANAIKKKYSASSIFWKTKTIEGVAYHVGQNLPAHYRERGVVVAHNPEFD